MRSSFVILLSASLVSCSGPSGWQMNSIATGDKEFDSSKLSSPEQNISGLSLELFYGEGKWSGYLASQGHRFTHAKEGAIVRLGDKEFGIDLDVHEGSMKARLPDDAAWQIITALKDGQTVKICVDSIEQAIAPQNFSTLFNKMIAGPARSRISLQGIPQ